MILILRGRGCRPRTEPSLGKSQERERKQEKKEKAEGEERQEQGLEEERKQRRRERGKTKRNKVQGAPPPYFSVNNTLNPTAADHSAQTTLLFKSHTNEMEAHTRPPLPFSAVSLPCEPSECCSSWLSVATVCDCHNSCPPSTDDQLLWHEIISLMSSACGDILS